MTAGWARKASTSLGRCSSKGCLLGLDRKGLVLHNTGVVGATCSLDQIGSVRREIGHTAQAVRRPIRALLGHDL